MRLLFVILVVAIAGLVWATIAAAQHIRRSRNGAVLPKGDQHDPRSDASHSTLSQISEPQTKRFTRHVLQVP